MVQYAYQEKRHFPRILLEREMSFSVNDCDDVLYKGTSQNICACGVYLTTQYAAKLGCKVKIIVNTPRELLTVHGHVVRCKFDKKNPDLFHVSIELTSPSDYWLQAVMPEAILIEERK